MRWTPVAIAVVAAAAISTAAHGFRVIKRDDCTDPLCYAGSAGWCDPLGAFGAQCIPIKWGAFPQPFVLNQAAAPDGAAAALSAATAAWTAPPCSQAVIGNGGDTQARAHMGDGNNTVLWVESDSPEFERSRSRARLIDREVPAVALVTVDGNGVIRDVDILLNKVTFKWTNGSAGSNRRDVQDVLSHELGHALGLHHGGCGFRPTTMCGGYQGLERRTLERDDQDGACFLYPPP